MVLAQPPRRAGSTAADGGEGLTMLRDWAWVAGEATHFDNR